MKKHSNPKCRNCIFRAAKNAPHGCYYISIVGHSRGCSVKECNKYKSGKRLSHEEYWTRTMV